MGENERAEWDQLGVHVVDVLGRGGRAGDAVLEGKARIEAVENADC